MKLHGIMFASALLGGTLVSAQTATARIDGVGPRFSGTNIDKMVTELKSVPQKSEFETESEYADRTSAPKDPALLRFALSGEFLLSWVGFEYDPESKTMSATLRGLTCDRLWVEPGAPEVCYLKVGAKTLSSRNYQAKNSFGATVVVEERVIEIHGVALGASKVQGLRKPSPTFSWPMEANEAREIKQFLKLVLECRQSQRRLYHDVRGKEATLSSPYAITNELFLLPVNVEALAVFDSRTGQIVKRFE
jgi:hypothetical protein